MIYLDNAATSFPKPEAVYRALDRFAREEAGNPGRAGHRLAATAETAIRTTRAALARLLGAESPERIVFTLNATDALNIALKGFLREGDHVVTSEIEHNSIQRPLARMKKQGFCDFRRARVNGAGFVEPEEILRCLNRRTRLVAITHASNVLGVVCPVEEYGRITAERGIRLLVDASQTVGVVPIDVRKMRIDMVAFPGHKNLFGPMGTGALYVAPGIDLDFFREGGTGYQAEVEEHPSEMPYRLEGGTPNAHGIAGLGAGLQFLEETGLERIWEHERSLALRFIERVRGHKGVTVFCGDDAARRLGPVSLCVRGRSPAEVGRFLEERYGIACRPGLHCAPGTHKAIGTFPEGTVRFSFGYFNLAEHADAAAQGVIELASSI